MSYRHTDPKNAGIRADMQQFYPLKAALEQILGKRTYRKLKETADLSDWKVELTKLLKAIELSIIETVKIADAEYYEEVKQLLEWGNSNIKDCTEIADLLADVAAILIRLVFLQIGYMPMHRSVELVPLAQKNWNLSCVRSVQYVQSIRQKKTAEFLEDRRRKQRDGETAAPIPNSTT